MLHDLLFAMCGNSGAVFKELSYGKLEIISGLPHISPNEETALNHLLILGSHYLMFQRFKDAHCSLLPDTSLTVDGLQKGCYLKAFCLGLDKVLFDYRQSLLKLEKEILADSKLSLLHIQQETEKYHSLFAAIADVIATLKNRKAHGCQILSCLHQACCSGNPFVKEVLLNMLSHCHIVMFKQLSSWLFYGLLVDRFDEFFITKESKQSTANDSALSVSEKNSMDEFEVNFYNLPTYIPSRIAQVICFIGSSLCLFQCADTASNEDKLNSNAANILKQSISEFLKEMHSLQEAHEFILEDFELCIDKIRSVVARELWKLCVERGQLVSYLNMVKDFFLLGRGELFLVFIDEASSLLKNPPSRVTEHDVQQIFLRSAAKIQIEDELPFQLFHLSIQQPSSQDTSLFAKIYSIDDGWSRLGMSFKVKWPLHTIFKLNTMEKYNHLFKFLLRVKRTQTALQRLWLVQMRKQQSFDISNNSLSNEDMEPQHMSLQSLLWHCRSHMQFFVDNLQYYLQADVLESHFTHLLNKIRLSDEKHHDFESLILAHDNFVNSLMSQCFVMSSTVCTCLIEILDLCQQFCDIVVASSLLHFKEDMQKQILNVWELYSKKSFMFFQVLTGVCSNQCNPHISQLTLRLDYNRHYSTLNLKTRERRPNLY